MFERYKAMFERDPGDTPTQRARPGDAVAGKAPALPVATRPGLPADALDLDDWDMLKPAWRGGQGIARRMGRRPAGVAHAMDALRTQLLQAMKAEGCSRLAITAPTTGCGSTYVSVNLALGMAAIPDVRAVLLDLNQRNPGVAEALGNTHEQHIANLLGGAVAPMDYLRRHGDNLAVALNSEVPPNPSELLQSQSAAEMLDELTGVLTPDVILCDMPPLLEYDDVMAFLPQVDAVLLVVDGTRTHTREIARCQKMLEGRTTLMGVVLNRGRAPRARV